jgi:site-specific recombinase XerD
MSSDNQVKVNYKYIDTDRFGNMTGDDNELKLILLQKYIDTAPRWGSELFHAMQVTDIEAMRRVLHQMKPHLTMIGSHHLEEMISALHNHCYTGESEMKEISRITTLFRNLVPEIVAELVTASNHIANGE